MSDQTCNSLKEEPFFLPAPYVLFCTPLVSLCDLQLKEICIYFIWYWTSVQRMVYVELIETCCYQCQQRCGTASSVSPASAAEQVEVKDIHIISLHCVCAYFVFDECFMHLPFLYLQTIKVICVLPVQSAIFKLRAIFHKQIFSTKLKNRISPTESPDTTNPHKDRMSSLLLFVGSWSCTGRFQRQEEESEIVRSERYYLILMVVFLRSCSILYMTSDFSRSHTQCWHHCFSVVIVLPASMSQSDSVLHPFNLSALLPFWLSDSFGQWYPHSLCFPRLLNHVWFC